MRSGKTRSAIVVVSGLLLALAGAGVGAPFASAASAAGSVAAAPARLSGHMVKPKPVLLRKARNPTGHTIRGLAPRGLAAPQLTTGPIVVTYVSTSLCVAFPSNAKAAVQAAVDLWNGQIQSSVQIDVQMCWRSFSDPTILGAANATEYWEGPGLPQSNTYYPIALANALTGYDFDPNSPEIAGNFSRDAPWYLGTDGSTPLGQYDFESTVLHELGHGLGFAGSGNGLECNGTDAGRGYYGWDPTGCYVQADPTPFIFDRSVVNSAGASVPTYQNGSTALGSLYRSGTGLQWNGSNGVLAAGGVRPQLFAPATWAAGTSYSHLDENTYPAGSANTLMTPYLDDGESVHAPGPIALGMMRDTGWVVGPTPSGALFHPLPTARANSGGTVISAVTPLDMAMLGRGGLPGSGVDEVVVNVEVYRPTAKGYISVTPGGATSQTASQEFNAGTTISNQVTVRLDAAGRLRLRLSAGTATVFVDVAGYYSTAASGDRFHPIATTRANPGGTVVTAGTPLHLTLAGHGIPGDATVDSVAATVEVYAPASAGYVRVTPDLTDSQTALQEFNAGQTISNLATVKLVAGKIQIKMSAGSARVFVDINGYYSVPSVATGYPFHPVTTARVNPGGTTVSSTADLHQQVAGRAGVPSWGVSGIVGVVEVDAPTAPGYVRTTPDGVVSQTATQVFVAGQTISNAVAVGLSAAGKIQLHMSAGQASLFVDVAGYFGP